MPKYKNLNFITLIAMFMIINIHFFNTFAGEVGTSMYPIMILLRGFALPAVTLYLTNTAYTAFYLKKGVNYKSLFLFIIIPTVLLTQVQSYMFNMNPAKYTLKDGFNNSWFGEMYIYMMLLVPLALYLDNKNKFTKNMMFGISIVLTIFGYWYSLQVPSATISGLGVAMMFPYIGLTFFMYKIISFGMKHIDKIEKSKMIKVLLLIIIIGSGLIEAAAYNNIIQSGVIAESYFSPFTIAFAVSVWLLVYSLDLSKLPEVRIISRSSYFLFFIHWIMIRMFEFYYPGFAANYTLVAYVILIIGAYIISTIVFEIYSIFVLRIMKL